MNILGWVLTVVCGGLLAAFIVWMIIEDWTAVAVAILAIAVMAGLFEGLQVIGVPMQ